MDNLTTSKNDNLKRQSRKDNYKRDYKSKHHSSSASSKSRSKSNDSKNSRRKSSKRSKNWRYNDHNSKSNSRSKSGLIGEHEHSLSKSKEHSVVSQPKVSNSDKPHPVNVIMFFSKELINLLSSNNSESIKKVIIIIQFAL